jgi:hypothetical protein
MLRPIRRPARLFAAAFLVLVCCSSEPASGPGRVTWDRDVCERCSMVIGDRRFAAQVRAAAEDRLHRFDDLGCALLWLAERGESVGGSKATPRPAIWVRDAAGETWIDGRTAGFAAGFRSPMGYGFAAVGGNTPRSIDLAEVQKRLLAREDERRSVAR